MSALTFKKLCIFVLALCGCLLTACPPGPTEVVLVDVNPGSGYKEQGIELNGFFQFEGDPSRLKAYFGGVMADIEEATETLIVVKVPRETSYGSLEVYVTLDDEVESNRLPFNVLEGLYLAGVTPGQGYRGDWVGLEGSGFASGLEVYFGPMEATVDEGSLTEFDVQLQVPRSLSFGTTEVKAFLEGSESNPLGFEVMGAVPVISAINPASVLNGKEVHIAGENFGTDLVYTRVEFRYDPYPYDGVEESRVQGGLLDRSQSSDIELYVIVPNEVLSGEVVVINLGGSSEPHSLTVIIPGEQDSDEDGISDVEEIEHSMERFLTDSGFNNIRDANHDVDGDEIGHAIEGFIGTDPWNPDGEIDEAGVNSVLRAFSGGGRAVDDLENVWRGKVTIKDPVPIRDMDLQVIFQENPLTAVFHPENGVLFSVQADEALSVSVDGVSVTLSFSQDIPLEANRWVTTFDNIVLHRDGEFLGYFVNEDEIRGDYTETLWLTAENLVTTYGAPFEQEVSGEAVVVTGTFGLKRSEDAPSAKELARRVERAKALNRSFLNRGIRQGEICPDPIEEGIDPTCQSISIDPGALPSREVVRDLRELYLCDPGTTDCRETGLIEDMPGEPFWGYRESHYCYCQNADGNLVLVEGNTDQETHRLIEEGTYLAGKTLPGKFKIAKEYVKGHVLVGNNLRTAAFSRKPSARGEDFFQEELGILGSAYEQYLQATDVIYDESITWSEEIYGMEAIIGEFQVNTHTDRGQSNPSIAVDQEGNFIVVWTSDGQDGSGLGIYAQRYNSEGNQLGGEFQVNVYTDDSQGSPSIAMDPEGNFIVVWTSDGQDGSDRGVYGKRYDSEGNPLGGEFQVNTYTEDDQLSPSVAMGSDGSFVVVWQSKDQDGSGYGVFGQRYNSEGNPIGGEFQVNTYTYMSQSLPGHAVAMDPVGNFVVVWTSYGQDGDEYGVYGQRYDSAGYPLGEEFQVNTYTVFWQCAESVAIDEEGNFVVVWGSWGVDSGVYGQRYDSDGSPLGEEFQVNPGIDDDWLMEASVAMDQAGNFVVVWNNDPWIYTEIYGQRYNSDGIQLGEEFQINTYYDDYQFFPSVGMDQEGNFVVVWQSYGQDGSGEGVYGQSYNSSGNPIPCIPELRRGTTYLQSSQKAMEASLQYTRSLLARRTSADDDLARQVIQHQVMGGGVKRWGGAATWSGAICWHPVRMKSPAMHPARKVRADLIVACRLMVIFRDSMIPGSPSGLSRLTLPLVNSMWTDH